MIKLLKFFSRPRLPDTKQIREVPHYVFLYCNVNMQGIRLTFTLRTREV